VATKTLYLKPATASGSPFFGGVADETAPGANAASNGWTVAKGATSVPHWKSRLGVASAVASGAGSATDQISGTSAPTKGTSNTISAAGDSFVAGPYTGVFAAAAWTFNFRMIATVVSGQQGRVRFRVWKSANADGTSATELTAGVQQASIISVTTTVANSTFSWSPGALTFNNEYLFIQVEWLVTTASGSNTGNVLFNQVTTTANTPTVVTPDFVPPVNAIVSQTLGNLAQAAAATVVDPRTATRVMNAATPTFPSWTFTRSGTGATHFNSSGVLTVSTANTPRITYKYNGSTWVLAGMLYEPASTNYQNGLFAGSNVNFDGGVTGIDGTTTTNEFTPNTTNGFHGFAISSTFTGVRASFSIVVNSDYSQNLFRESLSTGDGAGWNLSPGGTVFTGVTSGHGTSNGTIENLGNGFFRCSCLVTLASSGAIGGAVYAGDGGYTGGDPNGYAWVGDSIKKHNYERWQIEDTDAPTSIIVGTSRSADSATWTLRSDTTAIQLTFDNDTKQIIDGLTGGASYTLTTSLNRYTIKYIDELGGAAASAVVSQTLGALTQALTGTVSAAAIVAAQSLGGLGQTATAAVRLAAAASQTFGALTQTLTATARDTAAVAQTLAAIQQTATALATVAAAVSQSLGNLGQAAAGTAIDTAAVSQALGALGQAAAGGVLDQATVNQTLGALQQAAAMQHTPATAVYAGVLGALGQAATAAAALAATTSQSLGNLGQAATAAARLAAVVNQTFGTLGQAATATAPVAAVVNQSLGALQQAATAAARVAATVAQTLPALTQATTGGPVDQATVAQTLGPLAQVVTAAVTAAASVAQTLGALQQTATVTTGAASVTAVVNQTLGSIGQVATAAVIATAAISQALGALGQAFTATARDTATAAQQLGNLTQTAAATASLAATVAQSLGQLVQSVSGAAIDSAVTAQTFGQLVQSAAAAATDTATVAQTLPALQQVVFSSQQAHAVVDQTLGALQQVAAGKAIDTATAAQALAGLVQVITGTAIDAATVTQALGGLGQIATAVHVSGASVDQTLPSLSQVATARGTVTATVAQVLGALAQIATATTDQSAHAAVDQILGALQQVATARVPNSAAAHQILGALIQVATGRQARIPHTYIKGSLAGLLKSSGSFASTPHIRGSLVGTRHIKGQLN
jgi:hypothetical protein